MSFLEFRYLAGCCWQRPWTWGIVGISPTNLMTNRLLHFGWRSALLAFALALGQIGCVSGTHSVSVSLGTHEPQEEVVAVSEGETFKRTVKANAEDWKVHLVCWNVHKSTDAIFEKELRSLVKDVGVDEGLMFCLQEARSATWDAIRRLCPNDSLFGHYAESWRYPMATTSTGVMTINGPGLPAVESERLHSGGREFFLTSPKVSLVSGLVLPDGQLLRVANCHGLNFVTEKNFQAQLDDLFRSLEEGSNSGPAIVCGDFNVWSSRRLAALEQRVQAAGLTEASADGHSGPDTPVILRALTPLLGYDPGIPLDRIYTRGLKVLGCRSVKGLESSDHAPLVLEFAAEA